MTLIQQQPSLAPFDLWVAGGLNNLGLPWQYRRLPERAVDRGHGTFRIPSFGRMYSLDIGLRVEAVNAHPRAIAALRHWHSLHRETGIEPILVLCPVEHRRIKIDGATLLAIMRESFEAWAIEYGHLRPKRPR
jgi:hypothetical protein